MENDSNTKSAGGSVSGSYDYSGATPERGWFRCPREILRHAEIQGKPAQMALVFYLLGNVTYEKAAIMHITGGAKRSAVEYQLEPGQLVTTGPQLAAAIGLDPESGRQKIKRILDQFEATNGPHKISVQPHLKRLILTLIHYPKFKTENAENNPKRTKYRTINFVRADEINQRNLNNNNDMENNKSSERTKSNTKTDEIPDEIGSPNIGKEGTIRSKQNTCAHEEGPWSWEMTRSKWLPQIQEFGDYTLAEARAAWVDLSKESHPETGAWIDRGRVMTDPRSALESKMNWLRVHGVGRERTPSEISLNIARKEKIKELRRRIGEHPGCPSSAYANPSEEELAEFRALSANLEALIEEATDA